MSLLVATDSSSLLIGGFQLSFCIERNLIFQAPCYVIYYHSFRYVCWFSRTLNEFSILRTHSKNFLGCLFNVSRMVKSSREFSFLRKEFIPGSEVSKISFQIKSIQQTITEALRRELEIVDLLRVITYYICLDGAVLELGMSMTAHDLA